MKRLLPLALLLLLMPFGASAAPAIYENPRANLGTTVRYVRRSARTIREEALRRRWEDATATDYSRMAALQNYFGSGLYRFGIRYPKDWTVQKLMDRSGSVTTVALFLSPFDNEQDTSRENINAVVEEMPSPLSMAQYTDLAIGHERALFDDYALLASQDLLVAGLPAHRIAYTATFQGQTLAFEQVWVPRQGQMLVWTLAASPATFDRYSAIFHQMLNTLILG
jgi:hypothetical protein